MEGLLPLGCHLLETELKVIWQLINLIICSIDKHGRCGGWGSMAGSMAVLGVGGSFPVPSELRLP